MIRLVIGNRCYSSWSLRGWLACKLSGLDFETRLIPMDTPEWISGEAKRDMPAGKVPAIRDGDTAVWDSLAIILWLADRTSQARFWPADPAARALAFSISAEMHSGFPALRSQCPMNLQQRFPTFVASPEVATDVARIEAIWGEALARFGDRTGADGFLFGGFSAADAMFAPVCTRIDTYGLKVGPATAAYVRRVLDHPWLQEWIIAARAETFPFDRYPIPGGVPA